MAGDNEHSQTPHQSIALGGFTRLKSAIPKKVPIEKFENFMNSTNVQRSKHAADNTDPKKILDEQVAQQRVC